MPEFPNTPLAICARTVTFSSGSGTMCICAARIESPRNIAPSNDPIHIRVVIAFFHSGGLNAGTPFEIASTPVTAAPPEAKAFRTRKIRAKPATFSDGGRGNCEAGCGRDPVTHAEQGRTQQDPHHQEEEVRGCREDPPRFAHASEVAEREDHDEAERDRHPPRVEALEDRRQRRRPRGDGHRDGQDVVGEERHAGDLGRFHAEVVARDQVGAASLRIRPDRLPVGEQQDAEHEEERDRDGHDPGEDGDAESPCDEDAKDLLRCVGRGRQVVAREDGERGGFAESLVDQALRRERRSDDLVA